MKLKPCLVMLTEYNSKRSILSTTRKKLTITLFAVLLAVAGFAQPSPVMVNVMVAPPYTSSISDYMNIPNKIVITLTHAALGYPEIDLYLKVSIIGDNGVSAISEPDFKPAYPINLQPGTSHTVNIDNISEAFNLKHIVIQGTTINELVSGAGLPEGLYQICVRAYDYKTGEPLSGDEPMGCSSMFPVTNLEPPIFNSPVCGEPQVSYGVQLVNVSWIRPAGAPVGTTYRFEMVEIPENVEIDPNEAFLTAKYPVLYEETSTQTMLILTVDKVSLNPNYTYVMRVTAEDPSGATRFRNNGTSEVCWFKYQYEKNLGGGVSINDSIQLTFLNPQQNADTVGVSSDKDLLINWCWITDTNVGSEIVDKEVIEEFDLDKYVFTIKKSTGKGSSFSFEREFLKIDSTGLIKSHLQLSKSEALDAGFEDETMYIANVDVYNSSNQLVKSVASAEFLFKIFKDEIPSIQVPVQAVINYGFKNYPEIFPVSNSEVIIEALVRKNTENTVIQYKKKSIKDVGNMPSEALNGIDYVKIASIVAKTNSFGQLDTIIAVPEQHFETDSVAFRIRLANKYYVDKDFKPLYLKSASEDIIANFGSLTAKTYAYSLRLNVKKQFTKYKIIKDENGVSVALNESETPTVLQGSSNQTNDENQQFSYEVGGEAIAEGIPVVLYREDKQDNIPSFEGDLTPSNPPTEDPFTKITVVALSTTKIENNKTYVTFDKLLATYAPNEEYYKIIAIPDLDALLGPTAAVATKTNQLKPVAQTTVLYSELTPTVSGQIATAIKNLNENSSLTNFVDSGKFVAQPMSFSLKLPVKIDSEEAYYRLVDSSYSITSCMPPTSLIKGRLLYEWQTDSNHVKRALANAHFRVIVDYVDKNNKSIGSVTNTSSALAGIMGGHWESNTFQFEGSDEVIPLIDQYATMGEGMTDSDGNFSIEVVNFNEKGNLGSGSLLHDEGSSKPPTEGQTPEDKLKGQIGGEAVINPNPVESIGSHFGEMMNFGGNEQSVGFQNSLNGGTFGVQFESGTQSFEIESVNKKAGAKTIGMINSTDDFFFSRNSHGPSPVMDEPTLSEDDSNPQYFEQFKRTFRIVIDGDRAPYFYPSKDVIELDPFESTAAPITITHYVKEFKLKVKTIEIINQQKNIVTQVQATVYRAGNKPEHLPQGEGDGEYTFAALLSPMYNNSANNTKYEQLWPNQMVHDNAETNLLTGLLQAERNNYLIKASSYVNTGSGSYDSTPVNIQTFTDENTDWASPVIPEVDQTMVLVPQKSRILVHVKDSLSGQPLGTSRSTRVGFSTNKNFFIESNFKAVDNYGYLELFADQEPLSGFGLQELNSKDVYVTATAEGFKDPTVINAPLKLAGTQATPTIALLPAATIKGRLVNADNNTPGLSILNGVASYIQADSGKVEETINRTGFINMTGYFEVPIAPKAGVVVKFIPKDVAWFDTTYVLTANDVNKQIIDLGEIKLYRRKHRIQFNIVRKMPAGFVGPATPVGGATVQLGQDVMTTTSNGTAKYIIENVSVNNYTFIVRGPAGEGYIPKTVNLKNSESRDFQLVNVELEKGSEITGTVKLDGNPVKNARVYIEVNNTSTSIVPVNYNTLAVSGLGVESNNSAIKSTSQGTSMQNQSVVSGVVPTQLKATGEITSDANLIETRTDALGKFSLKGIPVDNQKINIIATLDTSFTVSGDKQQVSIIKGQGQTTLNLTSFANAIVNKLYGFPLTIEKITPVSQNQIKVTGLVHWTEAISDFALKDNIKVLRVEDVLFDLVKNEGGPANAVAHDNAVTIPGITSLKLSYIGKYNVQLTSGGQSQARNHGSNSISLISQPTSIPQAFNSTPLQITKEDGYGKISGKIQIVDNSFNYPSSYLNFKGSEFFLARLNTDSTVTNRISVATSAFTENESLKKSYQKTETFRKEIENSIMLYRQQPTPAYYLCNSTAGPIQFKVINFDATAEPKNSFIDKEGKLHLNTQLACHIDHSEPENFSVNIPDLILDENKVYPASSSKPITIKLEEWTLEARKWTFSTTEGGILSTDALLRTKIIDIPIGKFVLRSDMFFMDDFKMKNLTMAGGKIELQDINEGSAHLNYEYKVGSDMEPHWNFSLLGTGDSSVAKLPALQKLNNYQIELNYVEILSNNEMIVQLMQKPYKPFLFDNQVAEFEPISIFNGPSYIGVTGLLNTGAPRVSSILLNANWTDVNQKPTFENVDLDFEGKGFVHFEANKKKIEIDESQVRIEGLVRERPNLTFNPMPATFYAYSSNKSYEVAIRKDWITHLSQVENLVDFSSPATSTQGYRLTINKGGMRVINNDWGLLSYEGYMASNEVNSENLAPTYTKFEVLGDVSANSDSMSVTGINTPFGAMEQVFDFNTMEMRGSLSISKQITMGAITLNSGTIETLFGESGFYVTGGCNAYLVAGLLTGTYNLGFMAGKYSGKAGIDHAWTVTNSFISNRVINTCYKENVLNVNGLNGIYTTVNRQVIDASFGFDFILASGYVKALALLGGDFYANFSSTSSMGADAFVFVDVAAGLSCITGTSISGGLYANAKFGTTLQLNPNKMTINGSMDMGFNGEISQSLVVGSISKSFNVGCHVSAAADSNGETQFNFNNGSASDTGVEKCNP